LLYRICFAQKSVNTKILIERIKVLLYTKPSFFQLHSFNQNSCFCRLFAKQGKSRLNLVNQSTYFTLQKNGRSKNDRTKVDESLVPLLCAYEVPQA
jgi:hypothetical protein